jgi:hypothetical protein
MWVCVSVGTIGSLESFGLILIGIQLPETTRRTSTFSVSEGKILSRHSLLDREGYSFHSVKLSVDWNRQENFSLC